MLEVQIFQKVPGESFLDASPVVPSNARACARAVLQRFPVHFEPSVYFVRHPRPAQGRTNHAFVQGSSCPGQDQ